jgi:hypothetical protein
MRRAAPRATPATLREADGAPISVAFYGDRKESGARRGPRPEA